jgi:hypothetical protein
MMRHSLPRGVFGRCLAILATVLLTAAAGAATANPAREARRIISKTGVRGGLAVQVGCRDGSLAAALHDSGEFLVQVLDRNTADVQEARQQLTSSGAYGPVSVVHWRGDRLPYAKNLVRLLVVRQRSGLSDAEIRRALSPRGVACIRQGDGWRTMRRGWPEEMGQWTHLLHGPDNNAVSSDRRVGRPRHIQWRARPLWGRSHDHLATVSTVVSAGGRIFYIVDRGPSASIAMPSDWHLVARDAFSGVRLWNRPVSPWERRFRGFRTGPPQLGRRLVAKRDRVYATLGLGKPVAALHAGTGEVLRTYEETEGAEEIICADGKLFVVIGSPRAMQAARVVRPYECWTPPRASFCGPQTRTRPDT